MNLASIMNLAGPDMIIILLIVLVLFGAKRLPELARGMGQSIREFHKAKDEFSQDLRSSTSGNTIAPDRLPPSAPTPDQETAGAAGSKSTV